VNAAVQFALAAHGGEYPAFPTLISSGERTGPLHNLPSDRVLQVGDPIFMEIAGVRHRYNVNLLRTVFVEEAPPLAREIYAVAQAAFDAGLALTRPGMPVGEIDRATREARRDYMDYVPGTRSGFGIGLSYPPIWISTLSILDGDPHVLAPGYVFSLEPHIQGYNDWSITVGNILLVTPDGHEELLRAPTTMVEVRH
jgi:Xaa-Pro dipeptidase